MDDNTLIYKPLAWTVTWYYLGKASFSVGGPGILEACADDM